MMRILFVILAVSVWMHPVIAQTTDCVQESRVTIGETARITPGDSNNVRAEPSTNAESVGRLAGGEAFTVLAGPSCDTDFVWIQVQSGELIGWTVEATSDEYWIQPIIGELYENDYVSLMIPEDLASEVVLTVEDEMEVMGGFFPIRILGEIASNDEPFRSPRLIVAPIGKFEDNMAERVQDAVSDITILYESESEFVEPVLDTVIPGQPIADIAFPRDPFIIAARRLLVALPHYVQMTNRRGIAFITMYGQDIFPVNNDTVFYNFIGVTVDGDYLVSFRYPVRTDFLNDALDTTSLPPNWDELYPEYIRQATESLNTLADNDWEPSLDTLDEIIGSIYVIGGFE